MRSEESLEFTQMRRDMEDAEGHLANKERFRRRYVPELEGLIKEVDPREHDK